MDIRKILVTGSSGTIGTRLCELLNQQGFIVIGVDKHLNKYAPCITTHVVDLLIPSSYDALPKDVDLIIHLAANARVYDSVVDPSLAIENLQMMMNVLEFCRTAKVPRFIFASSREVYGEQTAALVSEDMARLEGSESPYTASKAAGEALTHAYSTCYNINSVIVRFSNVYGCYDESNRLVPLFVRKTLAWEDLTIFGAIKTYDFTYIDDACDGVIAIIDKFQTVSGKTYNIATGVGTSLHDVAKNIQLLLGVSRPIHVKDNRVGELMHYVADISKARKELGYVPKVNIDDGLRRSIEWQKSLSQ